MSIAETCSKYKMPIIAVLIILCILFACYAGSEIGKPVGRFIYNVTQKS